MIKLIFFGCFLWYQCDTLCANPLFVTDLSSPANPNSGYCPTLNSSSCCSGNLLNQVVDKFNLNRHSMFKKFDLLIGLYAKKLGELVNFKKQPNERQFIDFASMYSKITVDQQANFDQFSSFNELSADLEQLLSDTKDDFQTCYNNLLLHEAGRMCLMCDPNYIGIGINMTINQMDISLDVCIKLMRECFGYISQRIKLSSYINVINVMNVLVNNVPLSNKFFALNETFQDQIQFAHEVSIVSFDSFALPNNCQDQFDCQYICNQYISAKGLNEDIIVNPQDNYKPNFRRSLQIIDQIQQERRRMLIGKPTNEQRRELVFFVQEFETNQNVKYTFEGNNTMVIGEQSNFNYGESFTILIISFMILFL